ncbi:MAG: hypothetical protein ACO1OB_17565 [Archangium sp.]
MKRGKATRVNVDPNKRAYRYVLKDAEYVTPSAEDATACELAFLEAVAKDLREGTSTVVQKERRDAFTTVFTDFPKYEAQRVGTKRYLFFKFRLPSSHLPALTEEYLVKDGGTDFFEFKCALRQHTVFDVTVHGEA